MSKKAKPVRLANYGPLPTPKAKSLDKVLGASSKADESGLGSMMHALALCDTIKAHLDTLLPPEMLGHYWVGHVNKGIVTLGMDSSSDATTLRFMAPDLLSSLRQTPELAGLTQIECHIAPTLPGRLLQPSEKQPKSRPLSDAAKATLADTAPHIRHKGLRAALERMGRDK